MNTYTAGSFSLIAELCSHDSEGDPYPSFPRVRSFVKSGKHASAKDFTETVLDQHGHSTFLTLFQGFLTTGSFDELTTCFQSEFSPTSTLARFRGSFSGFILGVSGSLFFTDQTCNHPIFYYFDGKLFGIGTNALELASLLRNVGVVLSLNPDSFRSLLSLGFIGSYDTIFTDIHMLPAGTYAQIRPEGTIDLVTYHCFCPKPNPTICVEEAMEGVEFFLQQAVYREFNQDCLLGRGHLVELSGGLDSRMVSFLAYEQGYRNLTFLTHCDESSLDNSISKIISSSLDCTRFFIASNYRPTADDIVRDLFELGGQSSFFGKHTYNYLFSSLDLSAYSILHTGLLGDVILSNFFSSQQEYYSKPLGNEFPYTSLFQYSNPIAKCFNSREAYALYSCGFQGIQADFRIKQFFLEASSPFMDTDFLDFVLTIPFEIRAKHRLYIMWINSYHPDALKFGWEKWGGILPTVENYRRIKKGSLTYKRQSTPHPSIINDEITSSFSYLISDAQSRLDEDIISGVHAMYNGTDMEKSMALSVIILATIFSSNT